jgi:subtilase family serine protease/ribosomal protein L40E
MKGKADKLVANRTLSALVVLCVVLSAFAGFMLLVKPASIKAASIGDLNIVGTTYTMENIYQPVDGNVTIGAGGELFIKDATLAVVSTNDAFHKHFITVSGGGKLTLEHATITTYLDQLTSWPFLTLTVTGANSVMTATAGSVLMFPGNLVISAGALVSLHDTTVTAHPNDKIVQYYAGSDPAKADSANDGPGISLNAARLSIFDSSLESLPEFPVAGDPAGNLALAGSSNFLSVNSYVGVDYVPASPSTHNVLSLRDSHAYLYGTTFETYSGSPADRADPIAVLTSTSNATVYRWVNVTVGDEYGVPISGAEIWAVYTGSSSLAGQTAKYYTASGVTIVPPAEVLDYLGVTGANFNVTKSDGKAVVPYLSDIITYDGTGTVSQFVGSYLMNGSATIGADVYGSESTFAFPAPYPAMSSADRYYSQTVRIEGVSAQSPDSSRWLVVPLSPGVPSLEISNMTYYHSGDVIVAADGTLRFYNAEFQMIQTSPYQRNIYVDNSTGHPAMLVFEKSRMVSSLPINITVQGHAVLKIMNSSLEGVNIFARENSRVILINATMNGKLSTAWDASAEVIVKDSVLAQAPVLSGESRGHFTNSSVPSVVVEGNALAYIYRWIHVTVLDAAGKPLPGATVTAHSYPVWIPGIQNGSAVSSEAPDSLGVAKVNSLASILTSAGPPYRYVGNYMVSANYMTYWSTANISVGVLPYSEPLGKNATYATMSITGTSPNLVLPNLTVHQTWSAPYPVWATLTTSRLGDQNPLPGENVTVHATIYNDGVSYAYNVRVNFYDHEVNSSTPDESRLIGTVVIPMLRPLGEHADVQVYWTAAGIVSPSEHTLIVKVDPDNTVVELDDPAVTLGYGFLTVQSLPDLYLFAGPEGAREVTCSATSIVVNSTVTLSARIHNLGTLSVSSIPVDFYDDGVLIDSTTVSVPAGGQAQASVFWTPTMPAPVHTIRVEVNPSPYSVVELDYTNNLASVPFEVLDYPDLDLSAMSVTPSGSAPGGDTVIVTATLKNLERAPVSSPSGVLWVNYTSESIVVQWSLAGATLTDLSGSVQISAMFTAPILTVRTDATLTLMANPDHIPVEKTYANNELSTTIAFLDVRPDLSVVVSDTVKDIYVQKGTQNVTGEMFGRVLTVNVIIHNLGGSNATSVDVQVGVRNLANTYNHTLLRGSNYNVSFNATANTLKIAVPWTMNLSALGGAHQIWVWVDGPNMIAEPDESNNFAYLNFTVLPLDALVSIITDAAEYKAGDMMVISATVTYDDGTSDPVKNLQGVVFWLIDSTTKEVVADSSSSAQTTGPDGSIIVLLRIPTGLSTGSYQVRAVIGTQTYDSADPILVSAGVAGGLFPLWVWILIIVAVVGVVLGFFVYTYIYGLGKLVECGECGAFIPAASKRCPKCGVEFEAGTMKCSECGAWIPAESAECPNCGVKFVGEAEEEADYMERMRKEYDDMVSKYRELAKPELGKKFSEKAFQAWWVAQPGYISFEDWLAKEEEKKKEGPIPCPVCGTLNPKEATVCHKCGTVFGAAKAAPVERKGPPPSAPPAEGGTQPAEEKPAQAGAAPTVVAPRMVIRRPIDRKVVPKKIIKTPLGTEEKGSEEKEEDNQ